MSFLCYVIESQTKRCTYVGITNNLERRLRQHNGDLAGGAKYTSRDGLRPWTLVMTIAGFQSHKEALQFEWAYHHTKGPRALPGRIVKLRTLLSKPRWTRSAPEAVSVPLTIQLYQPLDLAPLPPHITVHPPPDA
jgi:predicted GIY-YIG superfamily endonuclease